MGEPTIRRSDRVVVRQLADEGGAVLLHLDSGAYRKLNAVGATIWELLGSEPTRTAVIEGVRERIPDAPPDVGVHVDAFLDALRERGLIEDVPAA